MHRGIKIKESQGRGKQAHRGDERHGKPGGEHALRRAIRETDPRGKRHPESVLDQSVLLLFRVHVHPKGTVYHPKVHSAVICLICLRSPLNRKSATLETLNGIL